MSNNLNPRAWKLPKICFLEWILFKQVQILFSSHDKFERDFCFSIFSAFFYLYYIVTLLKVGICCQAYTSADAKEKGPIYLP